MEMNLEQPRGLLTLERRRERARERRERKENPLRGHYNLFKFLSTHCVREGDEDE